MLRRIPFTPLVCLVLFLLTIFCNASWAAGPDEPLDILLRTNQPNAFAAPAVPKAKSGYISKVAAPQAAYLPGPPPLMGISKVKPAACLPYNLGPACILPAPLMGQWEMSAGVIFAGTSGSIGWPRYSNYYSGWWGWENNADLNGDLKLPKSVTWPYLTISYHFRPHWAFRYSVLGNELKGGGYMDTYFLFGPWWTIWYGQWAQTDWQHSYQRAGLVYDAIHTCSLKVSVFADYVHTDDKISMSSWYSYYWTPIWSNSINAAMAGLEFQRCIRTAPNGGTLSWDCKAGGIFLDNVDGWDVEAGARYSVPLNCGRWGYMKGGYRLVNLNKSQNDFIFKCTISGGYLEGGFIF